MNRPYRVLSLFTGAGGLDLGLESSGKFKTLLANELLESPASSFSDHFKARIVPVQLGVATPNAPPQGETPSIFLGSIESIDFDSFRSREIDVIAGGPPCQDFSIVRGTSNERRGIEVRRGRLYAHFVRALIHLQPKVFVFENVPGLKSVNDGAAYTTILEDFSKLKLREGEIKKVVHNGFKDGVQNYEILLAEIVGAPALGVPQTRRRLVIIGIRSDLVDWTSENRSREISEQTLRGSRSLLSRYPLTSMEVFEGLPLSQLQDSYSEVMKKYDGVADEVATPRARWWKENVWSKLTFDILKDYILANKIAPKNPDELKWALAEHKGVLTELGYLGNKLDGMRFDDGSNVIPKESVEVTSRLEMIPPDENHVFVSGTEWNVEGRGMSLIYRRVHPLKPSYTVVAKGGGGTWGYHYRRQRAKLTNRERARLQTFPDEFLFSGKSSEIRSQIGEAVPPLLGKRIAEAVGAILNETARDNPWREAEKARA